MAGNTQEGAREPRSLLLLQGLFGRQRVKLHNLRQRPVRVLTDTPSLPQTTMILLDRLSSYGPLSWALLALSAVFLFHFVPYFLDPHAIRAYPGPFLAKLSDIWLGWVAAHGHRSERVHELHQQYGQLSHLSLMFRPPWRRS